MKKRLIVIVLDGFGIGAMINNKGTPEDAVAKMADSINKSIEDYNLINN